MEKYTDEQKALVSRLAADGIITIAEFRGEKPEIIEYIDRTSGFKRYIAKHNIALEYLGTGEQVPAELYTPRGPEAQFDKDGKQVSDQPAPPMPEKIGLERGTHLVVSIGSFFSKQGNVTCRVKELHRLDTLQSMAVQSTDPPEKPVDYTLKPKAKNP